MNPNKITPPLTLREVMEDEFRELHGELDANYESEKKAHELKWKDRAGGEHDVRDRAERHLLTEIHKRVHSLPETSSRSALCLSGGGIRSATFGLGVLQGLSSWRLLSQFDYLSTVSGGGYIGSWLSAWIHRHPQGIEGVCDQLGRSDNASPDETTPEPSDFPGEPGTGMLDETGLPEPRAVTYLRRYSNYLTPRLGIISGDMWALAAIYFRNLLLNWLVLLPLLSAVLLIPRLFATLFSLVDLPPISSSPFECVQIATRVIWLIPLTLVVMWLPSVRRTDPAKVLPPDGDKSEKASRGEAAAISPRAVILGIIFPIAFGCILATMISSWRAHPPLPDPAKPYWTISRNIGKSIGLYVLAGMLASGLMRLYPPTRKPNPPRFLRLIVCYAVMGFLAAVLSNSLRMMVGMGKPSLNLRMFTVFYGPALLGIYLLALTLYVGITSRGMKPEDDDDREWLARLSGNVMGLATSWIALSALALWGPELVHSAFGHRHEGWFWIIGALLVLSCVVGLIGGRSESSGGREGSRREGFLPRLAEGVPDVAARIALLMVLLLLSAGVNDLLAGLATATSTSTTGAVTPTGLFHGWTFINFAGDKPDPPTSTGWDIVHLLILIGGLFAAVLGLGICMNFNRLSLHATYRNRLMRAYLGASNLARLDPPRGDKAQLISGDPYTGFDPADNLPMHHLRRGGYFTDRDLDYEDTCGPVWKKVAEYWTDDRIEDNGFRQHFWNRMESEDRKYLRALLEQKGREFEPKDAEEARRLTKDHLNKLLRDPTLVKYSRLWDRGNGRWADVTVQGQECEDVIQAYRRLHMDGSPVLLNRLVLERECVWQPRRNDVSPSPTSTYPLKQVARLPKPFHIVNLALNLVAGKNLAWQQRKATGFTVSPLHCGFYKGYRPSVEYGGGITLGTAMTISGAAATPNMGYHSSPAVTFLMTLFNARLGWWLGNPSAIKSRPSIMDKLGKWLDYLIARNFCDEAELSEFDGQTYHLPSPRHSLRPLIDEAMGRTTDVDQYVYLSDGGHFENLGLYEMVRRRCRYIVLVDATFDPECKLEDLGNAIRKIHIDMGITVKVAKIPLYQRNKELSMATYCAVGEILYSRVEKTIDGKPAPDGKLIYIKPARHGDDPVDVYNYGQIRRLFPHESTANQWFSESQFESYRRLGQQTVEHICSIKSKHRGEVTGSSARGEGREISLADFAAAAGTEAGGDRATSATARSPGAEVEASGTVAGSNGCTEGSGAEKMPPAWHADAPHEGANKRKPDQPAPV